MDVYDPTLTQSQSKPDSEAESKEARTAQADDSKAQQSSSQSSSSVQPVELESPTLEQEVQQLVGGITSWWSGVTKKSQQSLAQAQSHIQSQGGILNLAKKEFAHFESQITEAQQKARDQTQVPTSPTPSSDPSTFTTLTLDKGKGKAKETENEELVSPLSEKQTEILDVNSPGGFNEGGSLDFEKSRELALQEAKNAANLASNFFNRIAGEVGPRMVDLGKGLPESLNTSNTTSTYSNEKELDTEIGSKKPLNINSTLSNLATTFQKQIPNLGFEKSQNLARKYLEASEKGLRDAGKEMKGLMGDLVKIVPEDGKTLEEHHGISKEEVKKSNDGIKTATAVGKTMEEEIGWDHESDEEKDEKKEKQKGKGDGVGIGKVEEKKEVKEVEAATRPPTGSFDVDESKEKKGEDSEDDDWE